MIKILILEGCNKCKKLKESLDSSNVEYATIVCKDDTPICDEVEDLTGIYQYPMAIYVDDFGSITNVFYVTDKYEDVGKLRKLSLGVTGLGFYSIEQLISYLIK
jgi:glutaredoxin